VGVAGATLTIDTPGRDEALGFAAGQWVEVLDLDRARRGEPGCLGRLSRVEGTELVVDQWEDRCPVAVDPRVPTVVRRWDSERRDSEEPQGTILATSQWIPLEDGVEVQFEAGGTVRTGDFWLIPARTADLEGVDARPGLLGGVEWPREGKDPAYQLRHGVEHRFAPVALLRREGDGWHLVGDCRRRFPPLTEQREARYAGGDGQEAVPGEELLQPLAVAVTAGGRPLPGATVRFAAADDDGRLARTAGELAGAAGSSLDVVTDEHGVARVHWLPAPNRARPSQRVDACLLGRGGDPTGATLAFSASLSLAERVWFDPGDCTALTGAGTVQEAFEELVAARSIVAVGGNGQVGLPGTALRHPVEVLVRSDCGPVEGAVVSFAVDSGAVATSPGGLGGGDTTVQGTTDAEGLALAWWQLGDDPHGQVLTASLEPDGGPDEQPTQLRFTASPDTGAQVRPGLHVTGVELDDGTALLNDDLVAVEQSLDGLRVVLDGVADSATVDGKPVLTVSLDLPNPVLTPGGDLWGDAVVGFVPLVLAGEVSHLLVDGDGEPHSAVVWTPSEATGGFLGRLFTRLQELAVTRVLGRVTLTGWAVAGAGDRAGENVNGRAFGRSRDGRIDLGLPTGDDVAGADFSLWFWLMADVDQLVLVPRRLGLFRRPPVRTLVRAAVPRGELRSRLPQGFRVRAEPPMDPGELRSSADRVFRNGAPRRLVLVVDEDYREAAEILADVLGGVDVELELVVAADPVDVARTRIEAGEDLDGVLTDSFSVAQVRAVSGFGEEFPL
jgi:hypothetical protein